VSLPPAPLFNWQDRHRVEVLEATRSGLIAMCNALKPHYHRRVVLMGRVASLTTEILAAETALMKERIPLIRPFGTPSPSRGEGNTVNTL
jgi:hypothetical protein